MTQTIKVALLGGGTVGSQVVRLLIENVQDLSARAGATLEVVGVAVRDLRRERPGIPTRLLTDDPMALVTRPDVDLVIEVMGGIEPARELILAALDNGASVVSANKALIAEDGAVLHAAAERNSVDLY